MRSRNTAANDSFIHEVEIAAVIPLRLFQDTVMVAAGRAAVQTETNVIRRTTQVSVPRIRCQTGAVSRH